MCNEHLKILKITGIIILVLGILATLFYIVYSFSLFWQAFAAGITISILLIIVFVLVVLAVYLWIKNFLLKRELKKKEIEIEQLKIQLSMFKSQLRKKDTKISE